MFTKFAVFCVAIFSVFIQIQGHNPSDVSIGRNEAEELLNKLEETVDKALVQAQDALDKAKIAVNKTAKAIEATAIKKMQITEDKLKKKVDAFKKAAANTGVSIDDCLTGHEDQLVNMLNILSDNMVHRISDEINQGIRYAQDSLDKVKNVVVEAENTRKEIKDCDSGLKAAKCLAKLTIKIEKRIISLPTQIAVDAAASAVLISQLEDRVKKYASGRVDDYERKGEEIILTINKCVAGKIIE